MRGRLAATNRLAPSTVPLYVPVAALALSLATLGVSVTACLSLEAKTPADKTVALIRDAKTARDAAAKGCALYRAGVALGEVTPEPVVTAACDEAFPLGGKS